MRISLNSSSMGVTCARMPNCCHTMTLHKARCQRPLHLVVVAHVRALPGAIRIGLPDANLLRFRPRGPTATS